MRNLIINADDFGCEHDINIAIIELLKTKKIDRTTIMVNMPYALEAYEMAKKYNLLDKVGLHINLSDGSPLSKSIRQTRFVQNGILNHEQIERGTRIHISNDEKKAVREEVCAQFEKFKAIFGYYPKHVDGHRHIHNYLPFLFIIMNVSEKYGVESMRIPINLFDKKAGIVKLIYKRIVISLIKSRFKTTDYMGSWLEYLKYYNGNEDSTIEIMVHPTLFNNKIVDIVYENDTKLYYDFDKISK